MAEETRGRGEFGRGGYQKRQPQWRDRDGERSARGERGGFQRRDDRRGGFRDDRRDGERGGFQRRDNDRRDFGSRDDRRGDRGGYQRRDDRRGGFEDRGERGGFRRDDRRDGDRGFQRRDDRRGGFRDDRRDGERGGFQRRDNDRRDFGSRDDRRGDRGGYQRRDDRRGGFEDRGERGGFRRDDRRDGDRGFQRRDDRRGGFRDDRRDGERGGFQRRDNDRRDFGSRDDRRGDRGGYQRRDDRRGGYQDRGRGGALRNDGGYKSYSSTDEYVSPNANEPTIPAGVSAEELDRDALRALTTLSGPNRDIVARHLVMAGQLIDLDPEAAYQHAQAAVARAGRVDVVREAAALTAYASGRYEEALREVRAVRRMRGDSSLRAVEADAERGLGHPEKAVEIIDATDPSTLDLSEQVELVLVSSGARADLGQAEVGLVIVDDALAALPAEADDELRRRLMEVKAQRLLDLGREDEAAEVVASMPAEVEDTEIVDIALYADADVDGKRSPLRGSGAALAEEYDCALLDLDGTAWSGDETIEHAAASVIEAREAGMASAFVTNNAMRTPQQVTDKLNSMDFQATPDMVMTSAMDIAAIMAEELEEGSKVFVIGGAGLRLALEERGFVLVDSADEEPVAVVQGLDKKVDWALLSEGTFAIERGAAFYASNLDATLPIERGQALGNGSLVRAIQHATRKRPIAGGKPEPGIYRRAGELVGAQNPLAVGDRLETDIMGAVAAGVPALHVLTGVHQARDVIRAPRGQRPTYLAIDMRGLLEAHPAPKHHRDGTWTCGVSQVAKATRSGVLTLDDVELTEPVTISIDSYRALAAAAWEYADGAGTPVSCPEITVVDNEDPAGIVSQPEPVATADEDDFYDVAADTDKLPEPGASTPAFLPGEEELEELLERTADLDEQA